MSLVFFFKLINGCVPQDMLRLPGKKKSTFTALFCHNLSKIIYVIVLGIGHFYFFQKLFMFAANLDIVFEFVMASVFFFEKVLLFCFVV